VQPGIRHCFRRFFFFFAGRGLLAFGGRFVIAIDITGTPFPRGPSYRA
jgi:hypothetical protein